MKIKHQNTKTLTTRDNTRSSDAIAPNFIYGCGGGCHSYCYVQRFNKDNIYINDNIDQIISSIEKWSSDKPFPKTPNQVDKTYYCIDIGCSTDVALYSKHYDWQKVFSFFNNHEKLKSTFATKYPTKFRYKDLNINKSKNRIRISLMPQNISDILEPNTDKIIDRINMIPILQDIMEVHINFSPIVYTKSWLQDYRSLFEILKQKQIDVKCECIFLTYNENQKLTNSDIINDLLYIPELQEAKNSQYAADNIRYKWQFKNELIYQFKKLYSEYFDVNNIRYIF